MCLVVVESGLTADIYSCFQMTLHFIFYTQSVQFLELIQVQLTLCESLRITNTIPIIIHSISHRLQRAVTTRSHILGSKALTTIIRLIQINTVGLWYYNKARNDIAAAALVYFFTNKEEKLASLRFNTHKCCLEIQAFVQCGLIKYTNAIMAMYCKMVYGKGHIHEYGNGQLRAQLWNNPLHKPMDTWNLSFLNTTTVNAYVVGHLILKITYLLPLATSKCDGKYPSVTTVT